MKDLAIELLDFYQKTIPNEKSLSYKESIINGSYHLNMLFIIQDIILDLNEAKEVNLNERIIYVLNQLLEKTKRNFCVYDIANLLYRLNISTEYSNNFLEMKALVTELLEIYNIGENQKSHSYRENMFNVTYSDMISIIWNTISKINSKELLLTEKIIYILKKLIKHTKGTYCIFDIAELFYYHKISTEYSNKYLHPWEKMIIAWNNNKIKAEFIVNEAKKLNLEKHVESDLDKINNWINNPLDTMYKVDCWEILYEIFGDNLNFDNTIYDKYSGSVSYSSLLSSLLSKFKDTFTIDVTETENDTTDNLLIKLMCKNKTYEFITDDSRADITAVLKCVNTLLKDQNINDRIFIFERFRRNPDVDFGCFLIVDELSFKSFCYKFNIALFEYDGENSRESYWHW